MYIYKRLSINNDNPANIIFNWFGSDEHYSAAAKYDISLSDHPHSLPVKVWNHFDNEVKVQI